MLVVDGHQHFWRLSRGDYTWNTPALGAIHRDFLPRDLAPILAGAGVGKTVIVQAAATIAETDYILGLADATPFVAGVVGWIDFERPGDRAVLERLARHPLFKGVRPLIQDIPDKDWMLRDDIRWAFDAVADLDLTFDALGFPVHLDNFARLFERHPGMRIVIDHGMKPQIRDGAFDDWAAGMARLARETTARCKLSGLVTEAAPDWQAADLRPYVDHLLASFGPDRILWGSDWPVVNLASDYATWLGTARKLVPAAAHEQVFALTAKDFYRLG